MRNHSRYLIKTLVISKSDADKYWLKKLMVTSFLSLGLILFSIINFAHADEVNPYAQNYREQNTSNLKSLDPNPDTKIFVSNHKDEDNISMLENGYDMIGSSGFSAAEVSPDLALKHAKAIKADTVLVYKKYESAKTPDSRLQLVKEAAKTGAEIDQNDLLEAPAQYYYYASYWAKLPTPLLGVHIIKLKKSADEDQDAAAESQDERGLKIIAVIKGSPAAKASIVRGDNLLKVGDVDLIKVDDLFAAVKRYAGQTVPLELERDGALIKIQATLNSRS